MARKKKQNGMPSAKQGAGKNGNRTNLGFETLLFHAADNHRKNLDPSDYKHVALGLIFITSISAALNHADDLTHRNNVVTNPAGRRFPSCPFR